MNDLDLRTALDRVADLVGSPSPDLLDQLVDRRRHQRRQRAGLAGVVASVVIIAAGIPIGASFTTRSDGGAATERITSPPSVSAQVTPATSPAPTTEATSSPTTPVASTTVTPETGGGSPTGTEPVGCPDLDTLDAALPADTANRSYTLHRNEPPVCSGTWAAAGYSEVFTDETGEEWPDGQAGLFRYLDGAWTFLDRFTHCRDTGIPAAVWERGCNVD